MSLQTLGQYRCPDKAFTPHPAKNDTHCSVL
ncbi:hypothetical protein HmCmsJML069_01825 [Escherichia coli]|nr:hypothetical protein HmCmsJML069_01825 [Escherichia coli]